MVSFLKINFIFKLRAEISSAFTRSTNGPRPGVSMWGSGTLPCIRISGVASEFFKFNVEICVFGAFLQAEDGPFQFLYVGLTIYGRLCF